MIEKNRDILSGAIKNMVQRSPDASAWHHIAGRLDHLDALAFSEKARQSLPEHKAPQGTWSGIAAKLPPATSSFWSGIAGKIIAGIAIVGSVTLAYIFFTQGEEKSIPETADINNPVQIVNNDPPSPVQIQDDNTETERNTMKPPADVFELVEKQSVSPATEASSTALYPLSKDPERTVSAGIERAGHGKLSSISGVQVVSGMEIPALEQRENISQPQLPSEYYDPDRMKIRFKGGAFYALSRPDLMAGEGMTVPQILSSGGIHFRILREKWSLTSGLEYLGWTEKGNYLVDYDRYQLVYQYNYVDSALINTFSGEVTYYTSEKEVYDSIPGRYEGESSYRYKILQVPILLGYKLFERGRFSLTVMAGIGVDIRLSGRQYVPAFNSESATISDVRNSLQYRTLNNWRLIGGAEMSCRLSRRWEIYVQPSYQQYMKPMYSPENTKGTGLFKLQAGFHFLF